MLNTRNIALAGAVLAASLAIPGYAVDQKQITPKPQDPQVLAEDQVRQLLPLADAGRSGKVSKQEWLKFMEAEFDRLDKNKSGQIELKNVAPSPAPQTRAGLLGK